MTVLATGASLTVTGLGVTVSGRRVLDAVDLAVEPGAWHGVIGPNGAGKSTLLRAVAGLVPYDGQVRVGGVPLRGLPGHHRARLVALAPQVPAVPPGITVTGYVLLGRTPYVARFARESTGDRRVAAEVLDRLDLLALRDRLLTSLSGGERQRAVLARALAQQPTVLLLDEPTSSLDLGHQQQALELVDELRVETGLTVATTMHDLGLAGQYADRLLLLSGGRAVACGPPSEVLTAGLLRRHYGVEVAVSADPHGHVVVHPVRPRAVRSRAVRPTRRPDVDRPEPQAEPTGGGSASPAAGVGPPR